MDPHQEPHLRGATHTGLTFKYVTSKWYIQGQHSGSVPNRYIKSLVTTETRLVEPPGQQEEQEMRRWGCDNTYTGQRRPGDYGFRKAAASVCEGPCLGRAIDAFARYRPPQSPWRPCVEVFNLSLLEQEGSPLSHLYSLTMRSDLITEEPSPVLILERRVASCRR